MVIAHLSTHLTSRILFTEEKKNQVITKISLLLRLDLVDLGLLPSNQKVELEEAFFFFGLGFFLGKVYLL